MSEYKVIDDFQVKDSRILGLDRAIEAESYMKEVYIDGKRYEHQLNSVQRWIVLPGVHDSFIGKTVIFK